jgi:hypothetical protein
VYHTAFLLGPCSWGGRAALHPVLMQQQDGRPPIVPRDSLERLRDGYLLLPEELAQLHEDAAITERLEGEDPAYARHARHTRVMMAEELEIEERRRKLATKAAHTAAAKERVQLERKARREARERKRERLLERGQSLQRQRETEREKLLERIATSERRNLVRDTIRQALATQSRNDGQGERITYTHPSQLPQGPGPGTYEATATLAKGTSFARHPQAEIRTREDPSPRPGPGSYDPGMRPEVGSGPTVRFGKPATLKAAKAPLPGPGSYEQAQQPRKGGVISKHVVKSELEYALEAAATTPGPGAYELNHLTKGHSSTITGRTRTMEDAVHASAARLPGPGSYDLPASRIRGGAMAVGRRTTFLPSLTPGPGAYMKTPTVHQEIEMRELSRQVVSLARQRRG